MPDKQLMVNVYGPSTGRVGTGPTIPGTPGTPDVTTDPTVLTLRPNAAGINSGWSVGAGSGTHYLNVNEAVADDFTSFNTTLTPNAIDTYGLDDTLPSDAVVSQIEVFDRAAGTTSDIIQMAIRSGGTNYFSANKSLPDGSFAVVSAVWATDPATGLAWTKAGIDALEAGAKWISGATASLTQTYVNVTYTQTTAGTPDTPATPGSDAVAATSGPLLASWRDVSNFLTYRWGLNGGPESTVLTLPRTFGNAGVPGDNSGIGDLRNGNLVECKAVDMDSQDGVLVYQGKQRRRRMNFRQGVTEVTLLGIQSIQQDEWIEGPIVFTDMDPSDMMKYLLDNGFAPGLTWDDSNPAAGFTASLTITRQRLGQGMESIRGLGGGTWFWRINPDQSLTFKAWDLSAPPDHVLVMDREVFDDVIFDDSQIETRKKVIVYGAPATTAVPATDTTAAIAATEQVVAVAQAGDYDPTEPLDYPISNSRLTDAATAQRIANGELAFRNREFFETTIPVADNNFAQTGFGYDIETIRPGDTLQISVPDFVFSFPKWDEVTWDDFEWDGPLFYATQMTFVVALIVYGFDSVMVTLQQLPLSMAQEYVNLSDRLLLQESA